MQADPKSEVLIDVGKSPTCCKDCTLNFDKDVNAIGSVEIKASTIGTSVSSSLPPWLQQYKNEESRDSDSLHYKVCYFVLLSLSDSFPVYIYGTKDYCYIGAKIFVCFLLSFLLSGKNVSVS